MLKASWLLDWLLLWMVGRLLGLSCRIEAWQRSKNGGVDITWDETTVPRTQPAIEDKVNTRFGGAA